MKKLYLSIIPVLSSFVSFASADSLGSIISDAVFNLSHSIGNAVNGIFSFFVNVWDLISFIFTFSWELISGLWYGFNTIVFKFYEVFTNITGLNFFAENGDNISYLSSFLGPYSAFTLMILVFICIVLIVLRFIFSLIPFFKSGRNGK